MAEMMKALVLERSYEEGKDAFGDNIVVKDVEVPTPGEFDVQVKMRACGICHTDITLAEADDKFGVAHPITIGHEGLGIVTGFGSGFDVDAKEFPEIAKQRKSLEGAVVTLPPLAGGLEKDCAFCTTNDDNICPNAKFFGKTDPGFMAQHAVIPAAYAMVMGRPDKKGAYKESDLNPKLCVALDAVATPLENICSQTPLSKGETAVVFGAGGIGASTVAVAKHIVKAGLVIAVDPNPAARELAVQMGADRVYDPGATNVWKELRQLARVHVFFECSGVSGVFAEIYKKAPHGVFRGSKIGMIGYQGDPVEVVPGMIMYGNQRWGGTWGASKGILRRAADIVRRPDFPLDALVTTQFEFGNTTAMRGALTALKNHEYAGRAIITMPTSAGKS